MTFTELLEREREVLKAFGDAKTMDELKEGLGSKIKKAYHKNRASANAKKLAKARRKQGNKQTQRRAKYASKVRKHGVAAKR